MHEIHKDILKKYNIIDENDNFLSIDHKSAFIFFSGHGSNDLFFDFYHSYPKECIETLPTILFAGFHVEQKTFYSFLNSIINCVDLSKVSYSHLAFQNLNKFHLNKSPIYNIFYNNMINFSSTDLTLYGKNDIWTSLLNPMFFNKPQNSSNQKNNYFLIKGFLLKILEPYFSLNYLKEYQNTINEFQKEYFNNNQTYLNQIQNYIHANSLDFSNNSSIKINYLKAIYNNRELLFNENKNIISKLKPPFSFTSGNTNSSNFFSVSGLKYEHHMKILLKMNKQDIHTWILNKTPSNNDIPDYYLFDRTKDNVVYNLFSKNSFTTNNSLFSQNCFKLLKTMFAINHPILPSLIKNNYINETHLKIFTNELFSLVEHKKADFISGSDYFEPTPLEKAIYFTDFLDLSLNTLNNILDNNPQLIPKLSFSTIFKTYHDDNIKSEYRDLDLFILRTKSYNNFIKKYYDCFTDNSKQFIINEENYIPENIKNIFITNLFVQKHINSFRVKKDTPYQSRHLINSLTSTFNSNPFEYKDYSSLILELKTMAPNDVFELYKTTLKSSEDNHLDIPVAKFLRKILLNDIHIHQSFESLALLEHFYPKLQNLPTEEEIDNIGFDNLQKNLNILPVTVFTTEIIQSLREQILHSKIDQKQKNEFVSKKIKI